MGIPWGAYLYSYALNTADAKSELAHLLRLLKGKKPLFPIAIDMEDGDGYKEKGMLLPDQRSPILFTICEDCKEAGYLAAYYVNKDWYNSG